LAANGGLEVVRISTDLSAPEHIANQVRSVLEEVPCVH
jgi:hypothetical protein